MKGPHTDPPDPWLILGGILALALIWIVSDRFGLSRPITGVLMLACLIVFRPIARWSGRRKREKRLKELEELRRKPVLGLDD